MIGIDGGGDDKIRQKWKVIREKVNVGRNRYCYHIKAFFRKNGFVVRLDFYIYDI